MLPFLIIMGTAHILQPTIIILNACIQEKDIQDTIGSDTHDFEEQHGRGGGGGGGYCLSVTMTKQLGVATL